MLAPATPGADTLPPVLHVTGRPGPERFAALPDEPLPANVRDAAFTDAQLRTLVERLGTPIRTPVNSAWEELGPIMLALVEALRPRRYVELGSHNGYSFFAACQAAELAGTGTECVAIDSWQGDHHAGLYREQIYSAYRYRAERDYAVGPHFHIRSLFDDAIGCFEPGSIDLLLIDGLHTYEAVKHDLETWLPLMSSRGVIMFHDTEVRRRDFGVWQLWAEIAPRYPSFNVLHGHGLGIIYAGSSPAPGLAAFLAELNANAPRMELMQTLLLRFGRACRDVLRFQRRAEIDGKLAERLAQIGLGKLMVSLLRLRRRFAGPQAGRRRVKM